MGSAHVATPYGRLETPVGESWARRWSKASQSTAVCRIAAVAPELASFAYLSPPADAHRAS
eukprot:scaffold216226_cov30-Tisochrysis_lutea.AAC.6